jgi:hypothetical protein
VDHAHETLYAAAPNKRISHPTAYLVLDAAIGWQRRAESKNCGLGVSGKQRMASLSAVMLPAMTLACLMKGPNSAGPRCDDSHCTGSGH